jgi:hypothetical protein
MASPTFQPLVASMAHLGHRQSAPLARIARNAVPHSTGRHSLAHWHWQYAAAAGVLASVASFAASAALYMARVPNLETLGEFDAWVIVEDEQAE